MKKIAILIAALSLTALAFASASPTKVKAKSKKDSSIPNAPEWVTNPESEYNSRLYLTGVGNSIEENVAEDDAKAKLIQSLITKVSANEIAKSFADNSTDYASITSTVDTTSELKSIKGLKIVNKYKADDGTFYALAVIKKQDAVDFYNKQIEKNDSKIQEYMEFARKNSTLQGIIYAQKALNLAKDNEYFFYLIDIIDSPFPSDYAVSYGSTVKLTKEISELKKQVPIKVVIENDYKNLIKTSFTDTLNHLGFITTEKDSALYVIHATVNVEKFDSPDEKHVFYNYLLTSQMHVAATQDVINNFSVNGRAGHLNDQGAKNKAYLTLAKDIDKKFQADLLKYVEEN